MSQLSLYIGADNLITLDGLFDADRDSESTFINDATVSAAVKTQAGAAVAGLSSISMTYKSASDGDYRGAAEAAYTATLTEGNEYFVEVTATSSGKTGFWRYKAVAKYHAEET